MLLSDVGAYPAHTWQVARFHTCRYTTLHLAMLLGDVALQTAPQILNTFGRSEAVCALVWIASKYNEETIVLANFAYSQDPDTFKKKIIACERQVLDALQFDLNYTSPGEIIEEICKARGIGVPEQQCAQALCTRQCIRWDGEVTDARFLAAASLVIARYYQSTGGEWQGKREEMLRIVKEDVGVNAEELAAHCAENMHTTYLPALAEDSCAKMQSLEETLAQTPLFA